MAKVAKEESKKIKGDIAPLESAISSNQRLLESSISQLEALKSEIKTSNDAKISELNEALEQLSTDKKEAHTAASSFSGKISEIRQSVRAEQDKLSTVRVNISEIQKKLDIYNKNKCPHCLSDLTDEVHSQIKDKLVAKKTEQESAFPAISERIKSHEKDLSLVETESSEAKGKYYQIDAQITSVKREIADLSRQGNRTSDKHLTEVINNIKAEIQTSSTSLSERQEKLKVSQEMEMILSDNGMKKMLMSQIIPLLNKKILKTAKVLEFKFSFEFDLEFNPIITHLGMQVSPDSLSAGEQKKMNLIVLLCILELIKLKHNKVNLLFLDEVFSSLDVDSIFRVVDLLKTFAKKYNMTVFVISHDPLPEEYFDTKIQVENTDHFSDLTIV
jgi:DNA repair exonuclease SbcCD ATPase subunit